MLILIAEIMQLNSWFYLLKFIHEDKLIELKAARYKLRHCSGPTHIRLSRPIQFLVVRQGVEPWSDITCLEGGCQATALPHLTDLMSAPIIYIKHPARKNL